MLGEVEINPLSEGNQIIQAGHRNGAPGWRKLSKYISSSETFKNTGIIKDAFWEQYRRCLTGNGIDTTIPTRLSQLLEASGAFNDIVSKQATIPIGFWPDGMFYWLIMQNDL